MKRLEGKTALVSAAGQGIGRSTVLRMAAEGARVIATDVNAGLLKDLERTAGLETRVLDVLDRPSISALAADLGAIDILFNCAGVVHAGTILEATDDQWEFAFDLNVKSQFDMIRAFLPAMIAAGGGSIINMSSIVGPVTSAPNRFIYTATKAAVMGLTRSVAADYVTKGIRCNAVCPGTVDTPSLHQRLRDTGNYEAAMREFIARQPMGRIATPEEVAALVVYLASDESGFITGTAQPIDGGWSN